MVNTVSGTKAKIDVKDYQPGTTVHLVNYPHGRYVNRKWVPVYFNGPHKIRSLETGWKDGMFRIVMEPSGWYIDSTDERMVHVKTTTEIRNIKINKLRNKIKEKIHV